MAGNISSLHDPIVDNTTRARLKIGAQDAQILRLKARFRSTDDGNYNDAQPFLGPFALSLTTPPRALSAQLAEGQPSLGGCHLGSTTTGTQT
jgi:hypothetical protein